MAFNNDIETSELNWLHLEEAFQLADSDREARDMQDWQDADLTRVQARKEAADSMLPVYCDGSGIVEETYFAEDYARVIPCRGCAACQLELVEFGVRRKPAGREAGDAAGREVA